MDQAVAAVRATDSIGLPLGPGVHGRTVNERAAIPRPAMRDDLLATAQRWPSD
jgi:hypothetical protein